MTWGRKARMLEHVANRRAQRYGMRAYECAECGGWHLTSAPLYEKPSRKGPSEGVLLDQAIRRARLAVEELDRKHVRGPLLETAKKTHAELLERARSRSK